MQTDGRTDGLTVGRTDRPTDGPTNVLTHATTDLFHHDTMVKETLEIGYFRRRSSTGSISQSECSDFGYGPITVAICLATSGEIENLPLKVTNRNLNRIMTNVAIAPAFFLHLMSYYCCFCLVRRYPECWYPSCDMEAMISSLLRLTG